MNRTYNLKPFEWMVKYTPQEGWIKGQGVFLWLAFFFSEIGAGIYFVSLFVELRQGWLFGWLVALVLGGFIHVFYLGKPMRAWRALLRPRSSELSRGLWTIFLFAVIGFFQVLPVVVPTVPWTGHSMALRVIMGFICILLITHGFLTMSVVRAIPMWNTSMMIPFSTISGIWVASQIVLLLSLLFGEDASVAELWCRWTVICFAFLLAALLVGARETSETARFSTKALLWGGFSGPFYIGVVVIGIIIPLIITFMLWGKDINNVSVGVLLLRGLCVVAGDLTARYCIMKNGFYTPLVNNIS